MSEIRIERNPQGQYEMTVDGKFFGNYDSITEATKDYEEEVRMKEEAEGWNS